MGLSVQATGASHLELTAKEVLPFSLVINKSMAVIELDFSLLLLSDGNTFISIL